MLITVNDTASLLRVSRRQVFKLIASGRCPEPVRIGRSVRLNRQELLQWIEAGCPAREEWKAIRRAAVSMN